MIYIFYCVIKKLCLEIKSQNNGKYKYLQQNYMKQHYMIYGSKRQITFDISITKLVNNTM
jgi:hypothetical protein